MAGRFDPPFAGFRWEAAKFAVSAQGVPPYAVALWN
jgi:hypothetical protein